MQDTCHNVKRIVTAPPAWPPRPLKFTGKNPYSVPALPAVPPYTYKLQNRPCTMTPEVLARNQVGPVPTHVSGANMGFSKEGFDRLPPQCKRAFKVPPNSTKPRVHYAVSFHSGDVVVPDVNYPMNPCSVCHTHAWQAPDIKLIIAITTRKEVPEYAKGCFAYCEALGYPVVRTPWLDADAYFQSSIDLWACVPAGQENNAWVRDTHNKWYDFCMSYEGSFARWLTPLVVISAVFGTPVHVLQEWAVKEPAKLAELADKLPPEAQYAFVLGGDTVPLGDYGAKVWDYIADRADYVTPALLPFFASSRQFEPQIFGPIERGGFIFRHEQWMQIAHNADVLLFNVACMAVKYADIMKESRNNRYWAQRHPGFPLDQTPVWATAAAGGMVSMAQEFNYPAIANTMCLSHPSPDRELQMFHFYAHKPHHLNNPGTIGVPFLEPFYTAYCNGIRAAADAGFIAADGPAIRACAHYSAHPRPRECVATPVVFPVEKPRPA